MKQERLDIPAPYSKRAFVREKLQDLPVRQAARDQKRKEKRKEKRKLGQGRSDAELDREAQAWLEGTRNG
jgi:hypothetical protein